MTTLITPADVELTVTGGPTAGESLWSRILNEINREISRLIGKSWNYLNEDMGPVNSQDDFHFTDGFCC